MKRTLLALTLLAVVAAVAAAVALTAAALATGAGWLESGAIMFAALLIPLAATFHGPRGSPTKVMSMVTVGLYAVAALSLVMSAQGMRQANDLSLIVLLGVVATSWGVNLRSK